MQIDVPYFSKLHDGTMRWTNQVKAAVDISLHVCPRNAAVQEEWRWIFKRVKIDDHTNSDKNVMKDDFSYFTALN